MQLICMVFALNPSFLLKYSSQRVAKVKWMHKIPYILYVTVSGIVQNYKPLRASRNSTVRPPHLFRDDISLELDFLELRCITGSF